MHLAGNVVITLKKHGNCLAMSCVLYTSLVFAQHSPHAFYSILACNLFSINTEML